MIASRSAIIISPVRNPSVRQTAAHLAEPYRRVHLGCVQLVEAYCGGKRVLPVAAGAAVFAAARKHQEGKVAMSTLTEAIRKHHRPLAKTLEAHARGVGGGEPQTERNSFVAFLKGDLLPHARGEESHLYGAVDTLVREHGKATATMDGRPPIHQRLRRKD